MVCLLLLASPGVRASAEEPVYAPTGERVTGESWLVLIAINRYQHHSNLSAPRRDAEALRDVLWERYAFDRQHTLTLFDEQATYLGIRNLFLDLAERVQDQDSLLVYYAGHGAMDDHTRLGYWIPHDGEDRVEQVRWLGNTVVKESLSAIHAQHILLIADACFAGKLLTQKRELRPTIDDAYFRRAYQRISREVITSGEAEAVEDQRIQGHSTFAWHLIETLRRNRLPYLDPLAIYDRIRQPVGDIGQLPLWGSLGGTGHSEGGAFLFFLRESATADDAASTPSPPEVVGPPAAPAVGEDLRELAEQKKNYDYVAEHLDTVEGWEAFLEQYPDGPYAEKARQRLGPKTTRPAGPAPALEPAVDVAKASDLAPPLHLQPRGKLSGGLRWVDGGVVREKDGMRMVYIPPGSFMMGSNDGDPDERPIHRVQISRGFLIDRHEVTQTQYGGVMGKSLGMTDNPAVVSWKAAVQYCHLVGGRLPTEAEWELAARGGDEGKAFPWGDDDVCADNVCRANFCDLKCDNPFTTWTKSDGFELISPTCQYGEFGYGLCDMAGNVAEWVSDSYDAGYYAKSPEQDPQGPAKGSKHVARGGSYNQKSSKLRVSTRAKPSAFRLSTGIRCAYDL